MIDRFKLQAGPYSTPAFRYGKTVFDERVGDVEIVGLSDAPIPWPIGRKGRHRALILFGCLVDAVRTEPNQAVAHWWGVSGQTVTKWRKALDVDATPGTTNLRREYLDDYGDAMRAAKGPMSEEHRRAIIESKRGKRRPKRVMAALRKANKGRKVSAETRRKLSVAQRKRGAYPPAAGVPWERWEDELFNSLPAAEIVKRTGRTLNAVYLRRQKLGYPDGRRRKR